MRHRWAIIIVLFLWIAPASQAGKHGSNVLQQLPQGMIAIDDPPFATPKQKCENWLWAAEVETILKAQKIDIPQTHWVQQANLGEVCVDAPVDLESIAKLIDRDYQLEDGSKFHLSAHRGRGAPSDVGGMISSLRQGRPFILLWNDHPLLVVALTYDEYTYPNGQRMFEVREIDMVDLLYPEDDERRSRTFVKGTDDINDIRGTLEVVSEPIDPFRWNQPK